MAAGKPSAHPSPFRILATTSVTSCLEVGSAEFHESHTRKQIPFQRAQLLWKCSQQRKSGKTNKHIQPALERPSKLASRVAGMVAIPQLSSIKQSMFTHLDPISLLRGPPKMKIP